MVAFIRSYRRKQAMISTQWASFTLVYLLCQQSSANTAFNNRIYGDVTNDDVVIDHLEDYLRSRTHGRDSRLDDSIPQYLNSDQYPLPEVPEKIQFAVTPNDDRYFMASSVLRGEIPTVEDHEAYNDYPTQFMEDLGLLEGSHGSGRHDQVYHHPAMQQPQYPTYGHQVVPQEYAPAPHYDDFIESPRYPPVLHHVENYPAVSVQDSYGAAKISANPTSQPEAVNYLQHSRHQAQQPSYLMKEPSGGSTAVLSDFYFVALVAGCTAAAVCTVLGAGICYYRLHKNKRDAAEAEYPAYGVTGPNKDLSPGAADRKLAQSAHMFHYQHQKQQMIALEKSSEDERHCSASDVDSEEEGEEGDYTVYECPGLAPTGEMEVKNPLFSDDPTPATPAAAITTKGTNDARIEVDDADGEDADGD